MLNSGNRNELEVLIPFSSCHGYHIYKNFELQTIVLRSLILVLCFELVIKIHVLKTLVLMFLPCQNLDNF